MYADAWYVNYIIIHGRQPGETNSYIILEVLIAIVLCADAACYVNNEVSHGRQPDEHEGIVWVCLNNTSY